MYRPDLNGQGGLVWCGHPARTATGALPCSVTDEAGLKQCITDAFNQWTVGFCDGQEWNGQTGWGTVKDDNSTCCIKFRSSSNPAEFVNSAEDFAESKMGRTFAQEHGAIDRQLTNCGAQVLVNYCEEFSKKVILCYPCPPPKSCNLGNARPSNFCKTMAHEIGHLLGLGQTCFPDGNSSDLMYEEAGPSCSGPCWTVNDQCNFVQLYCTDNWQNPPRLECDIIEPSFCLHSGGALVYTSPLFDIEEDFRLYPNPAKASLTLQYVGKRSMIAKIEIIDIRGITLNEFHFQQYEGAFKHEFTLPRLEPGDYYIRLTNDVIKHAKLLRVY